jgi:proteic killer suppression protein
MIKSFKCNESEKIFNRHYSRKLPSDIQRAALRKLRMIHNSKSLTDLKTPPANHLEKMSGERKRQYSIRINDQWRVCFEWYQNNAFNVEICDYH